MRRLGNFDVRSIPIADGGEGTVDALLAAAGGVRRTAPAAGPYGENIEAYYGVLSDEKTGVVELATCAGLPLVRGKNNPALVTTLGVGQLILRALQDGCSKILLGLGGSASNDGGAGLAFACGVRFFDPSGAPFLPTGATLLNVARIDMDGRNPLIEKAEIVAMCDVDNPFCGECGAARVFAPQKGADEAMVSRLDEGLSHFAEVVKRDVGVSIRDLPGAGAAGGVGGGVVAFLGATLQSGIDAILDQIQFETLLPDTRWIFSGEGRVDAQTLRGKAIFGISQRAEKFRVPVVVIAGDVDLDDASSRASLYESGVAAVFSTNQKAEKFTRSKPHAARNLERTMENVVRLMLRASERGF